jgi:DNA-binding TFAR19-related protein (PDSD5 family)
MLKRGNEQNAEEKEKQRFEIRDQESTMLLKILTPDGKRRRSGERMRSVS